MTLRNGRRSVPLDDYGHRPGAYQVMGRAPGQLPVWARIRSIRRGRRSSRFQSWISPRVTSSVPSDGPELASPSVVMGADDNDVTRLSLDPAPDRPIDLPPERRIPREYQSWRDNVDIPREADSQRSSSSDQQRMSASSDETTDYSLPPELRPVRNRERSSNNDVSGHSLLPNEPSFSTMSLESRIDQVLQSDEANISSSNEEADDSGSVFLLNRHTQKSERRNTFLLYLCAILIGVGIGLGVGIPQRNNNTSTSNNDIEPSGATRMQLFRK